MSSDIRIFVCGDVMLARGIDMIQEYSCNPRLYEGNGLNANDYVRLAERVNKIPPKEERAVAYTWGDAIDIWEKQNPDLRIINLETAVTTSENRCRDKAIHYRMDPKNVQILKAAKIDCCVLSNNHTADWGLKGLTETLETLQQAEIPFAGAGHNYKMARSPAILPVAGKGRVLVYGVGHESSGVPGDWLARSDQCGLNVIRLSSSDVNELAARVKADRKENDFVILSIHWGGNWGFEPSSQFVTFAHDVIDKAGVDMIHGHSSHHVMGMEIYHGKLIMYGCGDFVNDYEGIGGQEEYRGDLALMYFITFSPGERHLKEVCMVPTQMRQLRVRHPERERDIEWLTNTMSRECGRFGASVYRENGELFLRC